MLPPQDVARHAAEMIKSKKGSKIAILDLRGLSSATDYFVIGSGESDAQVRAIADAVTDGLEEKDVHIYHLEGYQERRWILIDCIDVVIHVFLEELREYYSLERLWGDAPLEAIESDPE